MNSNHDSAGRFAENPPPPNHGHADHARDVPVTAPPFNRDPGAPTNGK